MEEKQTEEKKQIMEKTKQETEKVIEGILDQGINEGSLDYLYKVVDIHKDIANEEYWKMKEEKLMRYRDSYNDYSDSGYGNYSESMGNYGRRGVPGTGRYREGSYGRRGVPGSGRGRYRGEEMMDEMMYHYGNYSEGKESYGADNETMKSFEYMLKSFKDYYKHLKQEASSQQEVQMLEKVAREISEM